MTRMCRNVAAVCLLLLVSRVGAPQTSGPVQYVYDELGRLVAVIDANGNAAAYSYDAVGNILSISRYTASQAAVFTFNPKSGPVGTNVAIYGSGFSSTVSQDFVSFNGTSATILSASATQLVVSVPVGATTGALTITSPAGSVTTSDIFAVTNSNGRPRIDSFTPPVVNVGTAVTINGANFDPSPVNDRLMVNATVGLNPSSAAPASLTLTTPSATGSGRISLSTPTGTVTSASDLFIPPTANYSQYTVSALAFTGRTNAGSAAAVSIATANKYGLLLFDGNEGQMVSAVANSGGTFTSCTMALLTTQNMYLPDSRNSGQVAMGQCGSGGGFMDSQMLPATGTYALLISPGSYTGQSTITPYVFSDIEARLAVGGSPFTLTTTVPGQNGRFTFMGNIGQHVSITSSGSTFSSCNVYAYDPTGAALPTSHACQSGTTFGDLGVLSYHGIYTLIFDPSGAATGTVTFQLNDATDFTASITPGGAPVTATTTVPGQNIRLTFTGAAGQVVSALLDNSTFQGNLAFSVLNPSGGTLFSGSTSQSHASGFLDPAVYCTYGYWIYPCRVNTLPSNGTYTLLIDPSGADVGTIRAALYNVPADQTVSGSLGGSSIPISLGTPGQNAQITFAGTQNHKLSINLTGGTFAGTVNSGCTLTVLQPNGSLLAGGQNCYPASAFFDLGPLSATGTYTVILDPGGNTTGTTNVQLYDDTDMTMNIAADGTSNTVTTTAPGQNAYLNFSGTSGQRIFGVINNLSGYTVINYSIGQLTEGSSHSTVVYGSVDGSTVNICGSGCSVEALPSTDSYSIFLNPSGTDVGSATVTLYTVPADFSSAIDTAGDPVTVTTTTPGQNAQLTLTANSGQSLTLNLTSGTYPSGHCQLSLKRPDGYNQFSGVDCSGASHIVGPYTMPLTGTYTVIIDPQYAATGGVTVSATAH